jgi:hypothetical protein
MVSIRPEQMRITRAPLEYRVQEDEEMVVGRNRFIGESISTSFLGDASEHVLAVHDLKVRVVTTPPMFDVPEEVLVEFDPEDVVVLTE